MPMTATAGTGDFRECRRLGARYVDKTAFLSEFLAAPPKVALFTRPRRFGKTTTLTMMAEFLDIRKKGGRNLFKGLKIAEDGVACRRWKHRHPVILLSLAGMTDLKTFGEALAEIRSRISRLCEANAFLLESGLVSDGDARVLRSARDAAADRETLASSLRSLVDALASHFGSQVAVLVDDCDVPVQCAREHGFFHEMTAFLSAMLGRAFRENVALLFCVVAGRLPVVSECFLAAPGSFERYDVTASKYSDAFGFTQEEVDGILADAGLSHKREEVREWCGGYRFGNREGMHCPWDVMRTVEDLPAAPDGDPGAFRSDDGGDGAIASIVKDRTPCVQADMLTLLGGGCIAKDIAPAMDFRDLQLSEQGYWSLLFHAGYLTAGPRAATPSRPAALAIPNRKTAGILDRQLAPYFAQLLSDFNREAFFRAFWGGDERSLRRTLLAMVRRRAGTRPRWEAFYLGALAGYFRAASGGAVVEREAAGGRFGMLVLDEAGGRAAAVGIRRALLRSELESLSDEALARIAERRGADIDGKRFPTVLHWGLAFSGDDCAARVRAASPPRTG